MRRSSVDDRGAAARLQTGAADLKFLHHKSNISPGAPKLGPPASYFHGVWVGAPEGEAIEWLDELDALRWSIRCVRKFRDGSLKAHSYASADWRDEMPDQPIPPVEEINENADFIAKEITKAEFEDVWKRATGEPR
jgi:hypothetical protein